MLIVASQSIITYENFKEIQRVEIEDKSNLQNFFTMASEAFLRPMGYLQLIPGI